MVMMKILQDLAIEHIIKNGNMFFPDGPYGGDVYYIEEDGFYGPHALPDYIVPVSFSSSNKKAFLKKIKSKKIILDPKNIEALEEIAMDLNLSYGEGWDLDPHDFVLLLLDGCEPNTLYWKPPGSDFEDFEDFLEEGIRRNYELIPWSDLEENELQEWRSMLSTNTPPGQ